MKHTTDQIVATIGGFSFSTAYIVLDKLLLQLHTMSILEWGVTCFKTALVGLIGGAMGLAGKDIYNIIKNKFKR